MRGGSFRLVPASGGPKALPGAGVKPRGLPRNAVDAAREPPSTHPLDSCLEQRARRRSREQPRAQGHRVVSREERTGAHRREQHGRPPRPLREARLRPQG